MKKQTLCKYLLALTDFISLGLAFLFSILIIYTFKNNAIDYLPTEQFYKITLIHFSLSIGCILYFWLKLRHYTYRKPFWFELKEILHTLVIFCCVELSIIAFSKLYFSRYVWISVWIILLFIFPLLRIVVKNFLIYTKLFLKDTIIIGGGKNAIDAYKALISEPYLGLKVKYFIALEQDRNLVSLGIPVINEVRQGIWKLVTKHTDQFIIALEDNEIEHQNYWLRYLSKKNYRFVSIIPTLRGMPLYSTNMSFIFSYDVMLLRINNNLAKRSSRILKRIIDIIGSLVLILLLLPVFFYFYMKIKKDGGSIIYKHSRIGKNGRKFECLKFRSMVTNAQEVLENLLENDPIARIEWEKDFKLKNDPRITEIGRFLRRSSLDELPQLFNVLKGEMSLVGPRPIVKDELKRYEENIDYYLMAKPGMTGLWQVSGRNDVDYETRVYFDSWYVKNWSIWTDIAILFKTIRTVIHRTGAY